MKEFENFNREDANNSLRLKPMIVEVVITNINDNAEKEYLEVSIDINEGEYKGYFSKLDRKVINSYRSYKETARKFFTRFIVAIEKSNPGYTWNWNEKSLIGKKLIGVFGEEEYEGNDGTIKTSVKLVDFRSTEAREAGRIKLPECKRLPKKEEPEVLAEEDLPF